jgi:hypothetical protein
MTLRRVRTFAMSTPECARALCARECTPRPADVGTHYNIQVVIIVNFIIVVIMLIRLQLIVQVMFHVLEVKLMAQVLTFMLVV